MFFPMYCFTMPVNSNGVSTLGRAKYEALQGVVESDDLLYYCCSFSGMSCFSWPKWLATSKLSTSGWQELCVTHLHVVQNIYQGVSQIVSFANSYLIWYSYETSFPSLQLRLRVKGHLKLSMKIFLLNTDGWCQLPDSST